MSGIAQLSNPLWQSMCLFAFAFLVFSWVQAHKGKIDVFHSSRYIIFLLALLATISFSRPLFINGTALINDEAEQVNASVEIFLDNAGRTGVEGEASTFAIAAPIMGLFLDIAHYFASLLREMFGYFQWGLIFLLYSVSPLLLSFLAHPSTQNIGVRFLTTTFAIMMWKFGFVFADMIFIGTYNQIVETYVTNTNDLPLQDYSVVYIASNVNLSINLAAWLFIMLIILSVLYILTPLLVYLIFSGASPAGALGASIGAAIGTSSGFSKLSSTLASSRKGLSSAMGKPSSTSGAGALQKMGAAMAPLNSNASSTPMMGLSAGEVSQREQEKG